ITQAGSSTSGGDRDAWLRDLFNAAAWDPNVVGLVYFNFNKETDWKVWDGANLAPGWREGMSLSAATHVWPLRKWFQPGPLVFTPYSGRFADDDQLAVQADVEWLAERGIITGCTERHFCPHQWVSREQVATFLVRTLHLAPSDQDFFIDDAGSPHETSINALAAAGFAQPCGADEFCPSALVSRQQLAAMLAPALSLAPSQTRQFGDFTGSMTDPWGAVTRLEMVKVLRTSLRAVAPGPVWDAKRPWLF
ncbi:MAG TPA: S-layer homology domain-containing protein, partial [Acidimicrobiia bacterium]|nr:S-layer homology domain-containing protein [Acidimicrobiia bacterium]